MRLKLRFILTCVCLIFASEVNSQNSKVTISEKDVTIKEIIGEIEGQTDYLFVYNTNKVDVNRKVSLNVKEKSVASVLSDIFSKHNVAYRVEGTTIMLIEGKQSSVQQNDVVVGKVFDETGAPIIGATVLIKGTTIGNITGVDGEFSLPQAKDGDVLTISYLGYNPKDVVAVIGKSVSVTLTPSSLAADEVVIIGYGSAKKSSLTGAISSLTTEGLDQIPTNNLSNALAGRAPGVNVTNNSGFAGASAAIRIRGSFAEPLYVINNIISSKANFDALDMSEVANISFLKDAASASVFGAKAGNGVVVVTTKTGKKGQKPMFSYKGSFSSSSPTEDLISYSATDELIWANRKQATLGLDPIYGDEEFAYFKDKSYNVNDYVWQNPTAWQHNISVNGGSDKVQYYMMLGYQDQEGSYKNLEYQKFNFRSNVTAHITDKFKVDVNLSGNQRDYDRFYWPYDDIDNFSVSDFYRTTFNWSRLYPFYVDDAGNPTDNTNANPVTAGAWHPVDMVLGDRYQKQTHRTFDGQIKFTLDLGDLLKGLETSALAQYSGSDKSYKGYLTHNTSYRFQSASANTPLVPGVIDPNQTVSHNLSSSYEQIKRRIDLGSSYQLNWFVNYNRTFGKHGVSGMFVFEQSENNSDWISGSAENLMAPIDQIFVSSSDRLRRTFDGAEGETARQSLIGRFNYNYAEKYIAEFSFRYDGNYKFAPDQNWGFFPSVSAAWRVSEEDFMKNVSWLSNLKLRGSYGTSGADLNYEDKDINAFQWRERYQNGDGYMFGETLNNGLKSSGTPNPFITWATYEVYDIGLDFGFFNNRLAGEFDYFYKNKNQILGPRTASVPGTFGASMSDENYAEQEWSGVELSLRWMDRVGEFTYSVNANIGYTKDKWNIIDEADGLEEWRSKIGRPNNRLEGYISEGVIRTQSQLDALPEDFRQFGLSPQLGQLLYKDIRGANFSEGPDGIIDANDKTFLSDNGIARINYGFGFNVAWRGISLDAHFQGVGAYDRMVKTRNGDGVFQVGDKPYFDLWTGGGPWTPENTDAPYPAVSGAWNEVSGMAGSTFWMRNGSYMRLKNLNVGYSLPKKWFANLGIGSVQVFANGTNLFYISGFEEHDPEQETLDSYPLMKTFTGGLSINF